MRVEQISKKKKDKPSDCGPLTQHEGLLPVTRRARPLVSLADSSSEISAQQAACSLQKNLSFFFFSNSSEHQAVIAKRRPTLKSKRFTKSHRPARSAGKVAGKREFLGMEKFRGDCSKTTSQVCLFKPHCENIYASRECRRLQVE